ncbi:MAG: helix-turn-helix transcriptional regulator [Acidobacteria bacterium]|nr:helix-turn-helix transcriptional regulator [Acidobacteriota bacterium]
MNSIAEEIPPREVVRCQQCQLVQFRTLSDMCRRCAKPLPSWIPFGVPPEEDESQETLVECDASDSEMPTDRAGRNRRVSIGAKIKELREDRQLTQIKMSSLLGIPRSYLSRIENNRLLPGPLMVAKFAAALKMDISELLPPERRKDGSRLFPSDPGLAALYTQIAKLPVQELGKVLDMVRQLVNGSPNLRREAAGPVELPRRPEAIATQLQPAMKPASASVQPGTRRLAIVAAKGSPATR